jgi:hypothetical protein
MIFGLFFGHNQVYLRWHFWMSYGLELYEIAMIIKHKHSHFFALNAGLADCRRRLNFGGKEADILSQFPRKKTDDVGLIVADIVACFFDEMKQIGRRDLKRLSTAYEVVLKRLSISYRNFANEHLFG